MDGRQWGVLGSMEWVRQELRDRYPVGMTKRQICDLIGLSDAQFTTFIMQMTRYAFIYEEGRPGQTVTYFLDPCRDDQFTRRILPYDRELEEPE